MPYVDLAGNDITDDTSWQRSRNQQANWETVNQLVALRTLPENINDPVYNVDSATWSFSFEIPDISAIGTADNMFYFIECDCTGVPMISGLCESVDTGTFLQSQAADPNIWFNRLR